MSKYKCDLCDYHTNRSTDLVRHIKSSKHIKNETKNMIINPKSNPKSNQNQPKSIFNTQTKSNEAHKDKKVQFSCEFCDRNFNFYQSMWKHKKYHCKVKIDKDEKIKELTEQNKKILEENNKLLNLASNNAEVAKKSVSAMTYALKHFDDAPAIKLLEDDQFDEISNLLMYDDDGNRKTQRSIEDVILYHHKQNTLSGILGDLIVKVYKKSNPKKQSAWSSDVTRLTFIIKDIVGGNKKSKWVVDKKGIHFTETIINPLMEKIQDLLTKYNTRCGKFVNKLSKKTSALNATEENEIRGKLLSMQEINLTILTIKLRKIHMEILKYVAPYFNLNMNSIDLDSSTSENSLSDSESDYKNKN